MQNNDWSRTAPLPGVPKNAIKISLYILGGILIGVVDWIAFKTLIAIVVIGAIFSRLPMMGPSQPTIEDASMLMSNARDGLVMLGILIVLQCISLILAICKKKRSAIVLLILSFGMPIVGMGLIVLVR